MRDLLLRALSQRHRVERIQLEEKLDEAERGRAGEQLATGLAETLKDKKCRGAASREANLLLTAHGGAQAMPVFTAKPWRKLPSCPRVLRRLARGSCPPSGQTRRPERVRGTIEDRVDT